MDYFSNLYNRRFMGKKKLKKFTVKDYKSFKGRQLFFIKSKRYINSCYFNKNLKFFPYKSDDERIKSCSIKFMYNLDDLKQVQKSVTKTKTKKKQIFSILFVLLNIGIVAGILINQLSNGNTVPIWNLFSPEVGAKWKYLIFAFLAMFGEMIVEALKSFHLIYITTHRVRPFLSYKSTGLCRYYDSITPMSSGGEPFQIYYLSSRGIRGEVATSIPLVKSLMWQIAFTSTAIVLLIFNASAYITLNPLVVTIAWIGVGVNLLVLMTILVLSTSKKVGPRIVISILKLLSKMRIIKNYQSTFRKVMKFVINYQNCMRSFISNILTVIIQLFLAVLNVVINALIPYFIYRTFVVDPVEIVPFMDIFTKIVICNITSLIMPIPGGSGVAEFSFLAMFSGLFINKAEGIVVWAMLLWRIMTYYSVIFRGLVITIYDGVYGNRKSAALVKSGYFNEKIHFAMIKKRKNRSQKVKQIDYRLQKEQEINEQKEQDLSQQHINQIDKTLKEKNEKTKVKVDKNNLQQKETKPAKTKKVQEKTSSKKVGVNTNSQKAKGNEKTKIPTKNAKKREKTK